MASEKMTGTPEMMSQGQNFAFMFVVQENHATQKNMFSYFLFETLFVIAVVACKWLCCIAFHSVPDLLICKTDDLFHWEDGQGKMYI